MRFIPAGFLRKAAVSTAALFILASAFCPSSRAEGDSPSPLRSIINAGEKAPGFTLKDLDGKNVSFRPGSGKPALLVFWSVFCPLCKELTPATSALATRSRKSLDVIGVNLDGHRFKNAVRSFLKENGMNFPVGLDDIKNDLFIASDPYGVEKTPTAVLVDGSGIVYRVYVADRMKELIRNFDGETAGLKKKGPPRKK
jgi:peroxiredoxin